MDSLPSIVEGAAQTGRAALGNHRWERLDDRGRPAGRASLRGRRAPIRRHRYGPAPAGLSRSTRLLPRYAVASELMRHPASGKPVAELDSRFSSPEATPTDWTDARVKLADAQVYWLSTVRPDGRPHVTPLISVWLDEALYFCTGPTERKARNLAQNPHCVVTTGSNELNEGLDLVLEGQAEQVTDEDQLRRIADGYESKYGPDWHFDVRDGGLLRRRRRGSCVRGRAVDRVRLQEGPVRPDPLALPASLTTRLAPRSPSSARMCISTTHLPGGRRSLLSKAAGGRLVCTDDPWAGRRTI